MKSPDTVRKTRRRRRSAVVAIVATVLLGAGLALGWSSYERLDSTGLATDNVIDHPVGSADTPAVESTNILLVGLDSRTDAHGNPLPPQALAQLDAGSDDGEQNTDTLILLHIPDDPTQNAVAFSIPRDSYVDIAGGLGKHKINSEYARGMSQARSQGADSQAALTAGRKTLINTVQQLTGLTVEHYAEVNLYAFSEITNAVGGVPVCLNHDVDDPKSGAHFSKGQHLVQGIDALRFVRQRYGLPRGDFDRIARQQAFLTGLMDKVRSNDLLTNLRAMGPLLDAVKRYVVVDSGSDLVGMAHQLASLSGTAEFHTIPTVRADLRTPADGVAVEVDPHDVAQAVHDLVGPATTPPAGDTAPSTSERDSPVSPTPAAYQVPCVN